MTEKPQSVAAEIRKASTVPRNCPIPINVWYC